MKLCNEWGKKQTSHIVPNSPAIQHLFEREPSLAIMVLKGFIAHDQCDNTSWFLSGYLYRSKDIRDINGSLVLIYELTLIFHVLNNRLPVTHFCHHWVAMCSIKLIQKYLFQTLADFRWDNKHYRVLNSVLIPSIEKNQTNKVIKCGLLNIALFCQVSKWFMFRDFFIYQRPTCSPWSDTYSCSHSAVHRGVLPSATTSKPTTSVCLGTRTDGVRWKKKRRESEVDKAPLSVVSLQPHDPNSFVPLALTDGLNGALWSKLQF